MAIRMLGCFLDLRGGSLGRRKRMKVKELVKMLKDCKQEADVVNIDYSSDNVYPFKDVKISLAKGIVYLETGDEICSDGC
jgi:hypothetical protein